MVGLFYFFLDIVVKENDGEYRKIYINEYVEIGNIDNILCIGVMMLVFLVFFFWFLE